MTRVFVYEHCCATGLGRDPSDPAHSLFREGRAMRDAVADDFRAVPGVAVATRDGTDRRREKERFRDAAAGCEWCLVIAPELDGELLRKAEWALEAGCRLLGPSPDAIDAASCKVALARAWEAAGVATPQTLRLSDWLRVPPAFPAVCKPTTGAGSTATFLVRGPDDLEPTLRSAREEGFRETDLLVQEFVPGRPASVAFLVGPAEAVPLLPTFQLLSSDGRFRYRGGELPIPPDLAERAVALGRRAIGCVPGLLGYVGVDLVLGGAEDGSRDFAIEVNPRLTTSYLGLRRLAGVNLAGAMLRVAVGEPVGDRSWKPGRVRFGPDGNPRAGEVFG